LPCEGGFERRLAVIVRQLVRYLDMKRLYFGEKSLFLKIKNEC